MPRLRRAVTARDLIAGNTLLRTSLLRRLVGRGSVLPGHGFTLYRLGLIELRHGTLTPYGHETARALLTYLVGDSRGDPVEWYINLWKRGEKGTWQSDN